MLWVNGLPTKHLIRLSDRYHTGEPFRLMPHSELLTHITLWHMVIIYHYPSTLATD